MLPYNVRRHVSATKHISLMRIYTTNYFVVPRFDMQIHGGSENLLIEGKKTRFWPNTSLYLSLPLNFNYSKCSSIFFSFLLLLLRSLDRFFFIKQIFSSSIFSIASTRRVPLENISSIFESYITRHVMKTKRFYLNYSQRLGFGRIIGIVELATTPRWSATLRAHRGALSY